MPRRSLLAAPPHLTLSVTRVAFLPVACVVIALVLPQGPPAGAAPARTMAVTIDDLPYVNRSGERYLRAATRATTAILSALAAHRAPAVGFVNENKLEADSDRAAVLALLRHWVEAGHLLGNHTYSHPDANTLTAEAFQDEIVRGEHETLQLMAPKRPYRMYFRHPMTHTGDTADKKAAIDRFLASRGYTIAPHTIENSDYLFNVPYARARRAGDAPLQQRLREAYLAHTLEATAFAEQKAAEIFGRDDVPQTLLVHTNDLNADALDALLGALAARGYRFITLDEAMADSAYATADTHVSRFGPTWLFRWSRSLGRTVSFAGDPEPPEWVTAASAQR